MWCHLTYLVILKILKSLRALRTLIPNDMPGLKKPQTTSKMLPTITCGRQWTNNITCHNWTGDTESNVSFSLKVSVELSGQISWWTISPHSRSSWRMSESTAGNPGHKFSRTSRPETVPEKRILHSLEMTTTAVKEEHVSETKEIYKMS